MQIITSVLPNPIPSALQRAANAAECKPQSAPRSMTT